MTTTRSRTYKPQQKGLWVDYHYDVAAAYRAVRFIETYLVHGEGQHEGKPFKLLWWQKQIVLRFFGWRRNDNGRRKHRVIFLFIPRKNGKTAFAAALALYAQFADNEAAAQVACAASDRGQAGYVFGMASRMVQSNRLLRSLATVYKQSIFVPRTASVLKVLSKKPNTKHGANIHAAIIDEVHAIEDRELVDVLTTGTIARTQPIIVYASTAGFDRAHFFYQLYLYAKRVKENPELDESWLVALYEADKDKWKEPSEWAKANPSLGTTIEMDSFETDFRMALELPTYENTFKRLRLNIWTEQDSRAIPMEKWARCAYPVEQAPVESLSKCPCFVGLDLASTTDLASAAFLFPPFGDRDFYDVIMLYWFPEANVELRKKRLRGFDLLPWANQGFIDLTPGEVIDYDRIRHKLNAMSEIYNIQEIAIDRWNATQLSTQLDGDGFTVVPTGQGYATMSDPTKHLLALILQRKINHRNNPVLEWNAANLSTEEDAAGNLKPSKKKSQEKIDGIVALIMALSRASAHGPTSSVYDTRGIRSG